MRCSPVRGWSGRAVALTAIPALTAPQGLITVGHSEGAAAPRMPACRISVIIPVHDRKERLRECLASLAGDGYGGKAEVLVISDGGPAEMRDLEREWRGPWSMRWIDQPKSGPAAARNNAIRHSTGQILLFLNDDVVVEPGVMAAHDAAHAHRPGHAVMGNTRWHPEAVHSEFMHWCAHRDHVHYLIDDHADVSWEFFHTLNASIDRKWFDEGERFDESFPDPAFEDTEFIYRVCRKGLKIAFAPEAIVYHHHEYELEHYIEKAVMRGRSARMFVDRYPELRDRILGEYHEALRRMDERPWWSRMFRQPEAPEVWGARIARAFLQGYEGKDEG